MKFNTSVILLLGRVITISGQCFQEDVLGTVIGNVKVKQEDFKLSNIMGSIMQLLLLVKRETFVELNDFIKTEK